MMSSTCPGSLLVTGSSGFVGNAVTRIASSQGYEVTGLSRSIPKNQQIVDGVDYVAADITDSDSLSKQLKDKKFEYVIHCAGEVSHALYHQGGSFQFDHHFFGMKNVIDATFHSNLKGFIQIGSSDEYGDSPSPQNEAMREQAISPYSCAKAAASHMIEMLHRTEQFPGIVARLFLVYGPGQSEERFVPQVILGCLSGERFPVSIGKQLRDFCYIDDAVEAILMLLSAKHLHGQSVNVASGVGVSIRQVIEMIHHQIKKGEPDFGGRPFRVGENMALFADIGKITSQTNWHPTTDLEEGLHQTIDWYCQKQKSL